MDVERETVRLVWETDFLILEALKEHGRNVAPNLEKHTGKDRKNINNRLPDLQDYGLVEKIGPSKRSGLYELTELGETVLQLKPYYQDVEDFDALLEHFEETGEAPGDLK